MDDVFTFDRVEDEDFDQEADDDEMRTFAGEAPHVHLGAMELDGMPQAKQSVETGPADRPSGPHVFMSLLYFAFCPQRNTAPSLIQNRYNLYGIRCIMAQLAAKPLKYNDQN